MANIVRCGTWRCQQKGGPPSTCSRLQASLHPMHLRECARLNINPQWRDTAGTVLLIVCPLHQIPSGGTPLVRY